MEESGGNKMYDYADKFINLANEMSKSDRSGLVGTAIRFAAARYSAYEASIRAKDLAAEKDQQLENFANDFNAMLQHNFEDYIRILSQK